jgi:hypothetical protein
VELAAVAGATLGAAGVGGADLGVPATIAGRTWLAFGDTWLYRRDGDRWIVDDALRLRDAIGALDLPAGCDDLPAFADFDAADRPLPRLAVVADGARRMHPFAMDRLEPDEGYAEFAVPTGGFALDDRWYVFFDLRAAWTPDLAHAYFLRSALACATAPAGGWSDAAPPVFARRYVASEHAAPADLAVCPPAEDGAGLFAHAAAAVVDRATLAARGATEGLPPDLRAAERVVFVWGASWRYPHSDLYLAAVDAARIDDADGRRPAAWWYRTADGWSRAEADAVAQIAAWGAGQPCIGEHSVAWSPGLGRFLLMYQRDYHQVLVRTAPAPWGPWSDEALIFHTALGCGPRFIHHPGKDGIRPLPEAWLPDGRPEPLADNDGAAYGPYLLDRESIAGDGAVVRWFTMSTWRPYQVHLMRVRLRP